MRRAGRYLANALTRSRCAAAAADSGRCTAYSTSCSTAVYSPGSGIAAEQPSSPWLLTDSENNAQQLCWRSNASRRHLLHRGFSSSAPTNASSGSSGGGGGHGSDSSSSSSGSGAETVGMDALAASMDKLVDAAVSLVEEGKLQQAVEVLKQGIELLNTTFPDRPELSELQNQAALLLLFGHQHEAAAEHAAAALEITQRFFGSSHPLTGHRLLRLGTIRVHAGQLAEAQPLLATAVDMLAKQEQDPSLSEAVFYLHLLALAAADSPQDVVAATPSLQESWKHMINTLGADSMIVRLALSAHGRQVGACLDQNLQLGEVAFKQHIALQEAQDPSSAELGLTLYQLATTYYANDMLADAGQALQRAATLIKAQYPPEHDLVVLCKHRLGMICAAGRDYRSAELLLGDTLQYYKEQQPGHPLAHEAQLGLAMARVKGLDPRVSRDDRDKAVAENLAEMRTALAGMAQVLGAEHLLVTGGSRYLAQLAVMTGHAAPHGV